MSSTSASIGDSSGSYYVPNSISFYTRRLRFSKNRVRIQSLSTDSVRPNGQVIVRLPSNTLLNMHSLSMSGSFRASTIGGNANTGVANPTNIDFSLINSLSVISNGGVVNQPYLSYSTSAFICNDVAGGQDSVKKRSALQHSIPQPLIKSNDLVADGVLSGYVPFVNANMISPLASCQPAYISSSLLGDLELRFVMNGSDIVSVGQLDDSAQAIPASGRGTWDVKDIQFFIETASVDSSILDNAIADHLQSGQPIVIPFQNIFSFTQTNATSTFNHRFSVSSNCVNKIIGTTQLVTDVNPTDKANVPIKNGIPSVEVRNFNNAISSQFSVNNIYSPNYQISSELTAGTDWVATTVGAGVPALVGAKNYSASNCLLETRCAMDIEDSNYDCVDALCTKTQPMFEMLGGGVYVSQTGGGLRQIQPASEALVDTSGADPAKNVNTRWQPYTYETPIDTYLNNKYVVATSFDMDTPESDRCASGLNSLGSNAQYFWNSVGGPGTGPGETATEPNVSKVYVICTSQIEVYQGSSLSIIQ